MKSKDNIMTKPYPVKRRFTRVFFSDNEKITGVFSTVEKQQQSFSTAILNISEGGLQISQSRQDYRGLQPGDHLILEKIIGLPELIPLADLSMQIKWIIDNKQLEHVAMGLEFDKLPASQLMLLQSFVNTCLMQHKKSMISRGLQRQRSF